MTEENNIDRTIHRYTPEDAAAVIRDLIDGEDPNTDAMAGMMDPVRRLLVSVEAIRTEARAALMSSAEGYPPDQIALNSVYLRPLLWRLVNLGESGHADEEEPVIESTDDRVSEMVKQAKLVCALNYGGNDVEEEAFELLAAFVELHDPEGALDMATPTEGVAQALERPSAEVVEFPALTLEGLAALLEADRDRLVIFHEATRVLDGVVKVSINGACVQLTMAHDPSYPEGEQSADFMVGTGNATQAARDLIQQAADVAENNLLEHGEDEGDPDDALEGIMEDLEQDTMGVASRIGDEAWTWYHAVKSEVERLQLFPEGGDA